MCLLGAYQSKIWNFEAFSKTLNHCLKLSFLHHCQSSDWFWDSWRFKFFSSKSLSVHYWKLLQNRENVRFLPLFSDEVVETSKGPTPITICFKKSLNLVRLTRDLNHTWRTALYPPGGPRTKVKRIDIMEYSPNPPISCKFSLFHRLT